MTTEQSSEEPKSAVEAPNPATPPVIGTAVIRPRQQVEDNIRLAILSGKVKSGQRLPTETELARQFSVSRTTVREALRSLSTQGLIRKTPGAAGGSFVQSVSHQSMGADIARTVHNLRLLGNVSFEEIALARQFLEIPSARLAAGNRTDLHLEKLYAIVERQKSISVDHPSVSELDREFHTLIAEASGNRVLASFVAALHAESEPVQYLHLSPEVGRTTVVQHLSIVKALAEQDTEEAQRTITEHLTYLRRHLLEHQSAATGISV